MKSVILWVLSFHVLLIFGCSTTENEEIVGTWKWKSSGDVDLMIEFQENGSFLTKGKSEEEIREIRGYWAILDNGKMKVDYIISENNKLSEIMEISIIEDTLTTTSTEDGEIHQFDRIQQTSNQRFDPIVTTPVDEVEAQGTQGHP